VRTLKCGGFSLTHAQHTHTHAHTYTHTHIHIHTHHTNTHAHARTHAHAHTHTHTRILSHAHTHTHTHTHIHTHTHTHTHKKDEKIVLVDKMWPMNNAARDLSVPEGRINWDHIYGQAADGHCFFDDWPIRWVFSFLFTHIISHI